MKKRFVLLMLILFPAPLLFSQIELPGFYGNNMVLQQKSEIEFLGWSGAKANSTVEVITSWNKKNYTVKTDEKGKWAQKFVTPSAGEPYEIKIKDDTEEINLENILFGEVWLCSGQSNMAMTLSGMKNQPILNSDALINAASNPDLRLFTVKKTHHQKPQNNLQGEWADANSESVKNFSAVAYQFGQMLQEELEVPVGIMVSSWGGTPIRAWMAKDSMKKFPEVQEKRSKKSPFRDPSVLYNAMIAPLTGNPVAGFLWYQGEADRRQPEIYQRALPEMVAQWRAAWGGEELPFYFVQIAPFHYKMDKDGEFAPYLREAQLKAAGEIPNSGMVVTADIGSDKTIHPPDKTTVAQRLVNYALGQTYNFNKPYQNPVFDFHEIKGNKIHIQFKNREGLHFTETTTQNFEVAGADGNFYPAKAIINNEILVVESKKVKKPFAVRYAFKNFIHGNLYNEDGLPASPFRTDYWPMQEGEEVK